MIVHGWEIRRFGEPLVPHEWTIDTLAQDQVLVRIAGCAACATDVEIVEGTVSSRHPEALPLGHEIAGTVVAAGDDATQWLGRSVIVPPVAPPVGVSGSCWHEAPRGSSHDTASLEMLRRRSGFASHIVVPVRGLCVVDDSELLERDLNLADFAVLAEAVGAPHEAIVRSRLQEGDVAIFVGANEPGMFGIQIAVVLGAHVVALDTEDDRLERAMKFGASCALNIHRKEPRAIRQAVEDHLRSWRRVRGGWKIFEMMGTTAGHLIARELIGPGSFLALVGYSRGDVSVRLHDLATYVATVQGVCYCMSEQIPEALELVMAADVKLEPLIEHHPMSSVNEMLAELSRGMPRRPILIPDFSSE